MVRIGLYLFSAISLISETSGTDNDVGCALEDDTCEDERGALIQIRERGGMNVNKAAKPRVALPQVSKNPKIKHFPISADKVKNTCEKHTAAIMQEDACKEAAESDNSLKWKRAGSWPDTPKGCYVTSTGDVYFNSHVTGGTKRKRTRLCNVLGDWMKDDSCVGGPLSEQVCKKGAKLFTKERVTVGSWKDTPPGCYLNPDNLKVYYNKNPQGSTNSKKKRTRICWKDDAQNEDDDDDDDKGKKGKGKGEEPEPEPEDDDDDDDKGKGKGKGAPVCEDRDADVLPIAQKWGQSFNSCSQVKDLCEMAQFTEILSTVCPKTCGLGACTKVLKAGKYNKCEGWTTKISDQETCHAVANRLGEWKGTGQFRDTPKGCYLDAKKKQVWFNAHATGGSNKNKKRTSLCRARQGPCADDNAVVATTAAQMGYEFETCSEVANMCKDPRVGELMTGACPWTCGICPTKPEFNIGEDCSRGAIEITSAAHCQLAASSLSGVKWKAAGSWKDSPVGCYINPASKQAFFNTHATGGTKKVRAPICMVDPEYVDTTPEPVCTDDDAGVQAFAESEGYDYQSCADVAMLCKDKRFTALAKDFCPWTCGFCKGSKPEFVKAEGGRCPQGTGKITGAGLCMVAAKSVGKWKREGNYKDTPSGCYLDPKTRGVYYNRHETGGSARKRISVCTVTTTTTMPYIPSITDIIQALLEGQEIDLESATEVFKALEPMLLKGLRNKLIVDGVADVLADLLGFDEQEAERVGEIIAEQITFDVILKLKKGEALDWGPILAELKDMEDVIVAAFAEKLAVTLGLEDEETESIRTNFPAQVIFDFTESLLEGRGIDWMPIVQFFDQVEPIMVRVLGNQTLVDATIGRVARQLGLGPEATRQLEEKVGDPIVREVLEQLKNGEDVDVDWAFMKEIFEEAETFFVRVFASKLKYAFGHHKIADAKAAGVDILGILESLVLGEDVDMESALEVLEYLKPVLLSTLRNKQLIDGVADVIANFFGLNEAAAERVGEFIADGLRKDILQKLLKGEEIDWGPILATLKEMEDVVVAAFAKKLAALLGLTDEEHENLRDNIPAQTIFTITEDLLEGNDVDWSPLVTFFEAIEPTLVRVLSDQSLVDEMVGKFTRMMGVDAQTSAIVAQALGQPLVRKILDQLEDGDTDKIDWSPVIDALNQVESYLIAAVQGRIKWLVKTILSGPKPSPEPEPEAEPEDDDDDDDDKKGKKGKGDDDDDDDKGKKGKGEDDDDDDNDKGKKAKDKVCVDDDEAVKKVAKELGFDDYDSCEKVSEFCDQKEMAGEFWIPLRTSCPVTCGTCREQCSDDDELVKLTARDLGFDTVETCADVADYCNAENIGDDIKAACPETCGTCQDVTSRFVLAGKTNTCPPGSKEITTPWVCKLAGTAISEWKSVGSWSDTPAGCYHKPGAGFYFNRKGGKSQKVRHVLCQIKGSN